MFNGAVLVNENAANDPAVMAMLRSQAERNWPVSSGFGTHTYVEDLTENMDPDTAQEYWEEYSL